MNEIIVQGTSQSEVAPDRARVHLTIEFDAANRDDAYTSASRAATTVDAVLDLHHDAIERVTTAALLVQPRTRWRKGEYVRTGWSASRRTIVEVVGFASLGALIAEATAAGAAISGPTWLVDPTNPAFSEVRTAAAADARARAEAYAAGLGVRVGQVAWVSEPGLRPSAGGGGGFGMLAEPTMAMAPQARAGGIVEDDVIDVEPANLTVTVSVEVGFAILTE